MPIDYRKHKRFCLECLWQGLRGDLLRGVNPFKTDEQIAGCPRCRSIDSAVPACDDEGCWELVTCGTSTPEGYRHTCSKHRPVVAAERTGLPEEERGECKRHLADPFR